MMMMCAMMNRDVFRADDDDDDLDYDWIRDVDRLVDVFPAFLGSSSSSSSSSSRSGGGLFRLLFSESSVCRAESRGCDERRPSHNITFLSSSP